MPRRPRSSHVRLPAWLARRGRAASRRHVPEVVVYGRARCGLCRRAEELVAREAAGAVIRHVDVDAADELIDRYGVRVPVVVVDGVEVAELEVAAGVVRAAIRDARRSTELGGQPGRRSLLKRGAPRVGDPDEWSGHG